MLKRKTPLRAKKPMARKPIKRKGKRKQSTDKRWRSEPYLAFVRSLPCSVCGAAPCDPHHIIGLHWGLSGQGLTAPDSFAMPLCRYHHRAKDEGGWRYDTTDEGTIIWISPLGRRYTSDPRGP